METIAAQSTRAAASVSAGETEEGAEGVTAAEASIAAGVEEAIPAGALLVVGAAGRAHAAALSAPSAAHTIPTLRGPRRTPRALARPRHSLPRTMLLLVSFVSRNAHLGGGTPNLADIHPHLALAAGDEARGNRLRGSHSS
jgi:hypothetical protein